MLQGLEFQLNIQPHIRRRTWSLDWPSLVTCILNVIFQPWQMLLCSCIMNHMVVVNLGSLLLFICYSLLLLLLICLQQGQVSEQGVILYMLKSIFLVGLYIYLCSTLAWVAGSKEKNSSCSLTASCQTSTVTSILHDVEADACRDHWAFFGWRTHTSENLHLRMARLKLLQGCVSVNPHSHFLHPRRLLFRFQWVVFCVKYPLTRRIENGFI